MIFSGPLVLIIMAFKELLGIFVVCQNCLVALAFSPHKRKAFLYVPDGLFMPSVGMNPRRFLFGIAFLLNFSSTSLHGRGLACIPFSSCKNPCSYKAHLLSRACGKLGKLLSLGFTGLVMSSMMGSL